VKEGEKPDFLWVNHKGLGTFYFLLKKRKYSYRNCQKAVIEKFAWNSKRLVILFSLKLLVPSFN
jgi:hypothetical protein